MDTFAYCPIGMERYEEARAFVVEYHANGDPNHPIVELEMNEMTASMREQGILSWRNFFDIRVLFKSRSRRYRMMLNIAMSWFGQFSGLKSILWLTTLGQWIIQYRPITNAFQGTTLRLTIFPFLLQMSE
jgi:hypothetical protein